MPPVMARAAKRLDILRRIIRAVPVDVMSMEPLRRAATFARFLQVLPRSPTITVIAHFLACIGAG